MRTGLPYHPALDGLRGIAVAGVVAYHFGWIPGGFLGVDAFFVLSGFLITSLLLAEHDGSGRIALGEFWSRRARRLLPAVLVLVVVLLVVARERVSRADVAGTLAYVANWQRVFSGESYFALFDGPSPLRHVWSLAIEEQFYLVWPLVVFFAGARRWVLGVLCAAGIAASVLAMAMWFDPVDPSRVYYGTDTRAHLLLVGALLAVIGRIPVPAIVGSGALAVSVISMITVADQDPMLYRGGMLAHAVVVGLVIAAVTARPASRLARALGVAPLRALGRVSYGLYLWHWPVIVLVTAEASGLQGWRLTVARLALIVALVVVSYHVIERPVRAWKVRPRPVLAGGAVALLGTVAVALVVVPRPPDGERVFLTAAPSVGELSATPPTRASIDPQSVGSVDAPSFAVRVPKKIAVVGDSVAATVAFGLAQAAPEYGVAVTSFAVPGCGIVAGVALTDSGVPFEWTRKCDAGVAAVQDEMIARDNPDVVVWLSTWELSDREIDGRQVGFGTPEHDAALLAAIRARVDALTALGARVVFVAPAPSAPNDRAFPDAPPDRYAHYRDLLRSFEHPSRPAFVDLGEIVCAAGPPCPAEVDGLRLRPDGFHFTEETAPWVGARLLPMILAAART